MKPFTLFLICATLYSKGDASLTPFITPCYSSDTDCLRQSAQNALPAIAAGIPSFGMQSLDPMTLERVVARQAGLDMEFRNTVVKGLRNCQVLSVIRYPQRTRLDIKCSVTLVGDYRLDGQLLILPVEGQGRYKIKIRDIVVKIDLDFGERSAYGQRYWTLGSYRHSAHVETRAEFSFQNLFGGNSQLAATIHEFANNNWRDIIQEVSPPIISVIVSNIVQEISKLFDSVPISDLSLD
ncbi:unnamed protein product, partial [Iphiclides podalirius]